MCEALDIIEKRGEERGEKRGEKRGELKGLKILLGLVQDGILSLSEAAKRADMSVAAFKTAVGIK